LSPRGDIAARKLSVALVATVFVMVLLGALVAGIRAGYAYNTFPLMNGHLVPPEVFMIEPWWKNFGYNMATVQFDHRAVGWLLALLVPLTWWRVMRAGNSPPAARPWAHATLAALAVQFTLGVVTLLMGVPLAAAALHQAGAVVLFTCVIGLCHALRA
jgi:cytochrome c oxidase assembly protein subunit 15